MCTKTVRLRDGAKKKKSFSEVHKYFNFNFGFFGGFQAMVKSSWLEDVSPTIVDGLKNLMDQNIWQFKMLKNLKAHNI